MSLKLAQQSVIVTGAAQGLGAAIARRFAKEGAKLALLDYNAAGLAAVASECGANAKAIGVDLSDATATDRAIAEAKAYLGTVDTLVHNAAILDPTPFADETLASFFRTVNVGLQAAFQLSHAVWAGMAEKGGGAIVFVSSQSGIKGFIDESAYCSSKHALEGLAKTLAMEGEPFGITANTITPGMFMHTPLSEKVYTEDLKQKWVDPMLLTTAFVAIAERREALEGVRQNAWELSRQVDGIV